jgi:hypothetical protein
MDYQSIHDPRCWISFKAAMDRSSWRADKFFQGENVGTTIGKPGNTFFVYLAFLPINEGEKHVARDWPAEEIEATRLRHAICIEFNMLCCSSMLALVRSGLIRSGLSGCLAWSGLRHSPSSGQGNRA